MAYTIDQYLNLIPSQNRQQPNFLSVITAICQPYADLSNLLQEITEDFDLDTAVGVQLDQVGQWIGRDRYVAVPVTGAFFSWNTAGLGWGQGYWKGRFVPNNQIIALDDNTYRAVLRAKIVSNKWDGTVQVALAAYQALCAPATVNIKDNQDMTMTVTITGAVPLVIKSLIENGEIPLKPEGVAVAYVFA